MAGILDVYEPYQLREIRSMKEIREIFPEGYEHKNNWLFVATQGLHGTHETLDSMQEDFLKYDFDKAWVTVLVIQPRLCNLFYGHISIKEKDIPFLKQIVKNTIEVIPSTQARNI